MPIYPGARVRLIDHKYLPGGGLGMAAFNRSQTHTQAGRGSLYNYYSNINRPSSHAWCSYNGLIEQYVNTSLRAEADLDGNDASISIEVEGGDEPYTTAQIDALIQWHVWVLSTHNIPHRIALDSKVGPSSHGLSWHRIGIDGNFPSMPDPRAGRLQRGGGMHYSSARGKTCPTDPRIRQLNTTVYPEVLRILSGAPAPTPPDPIPPKPKDDEMRLIRSSTNGSFAIVSGGFFRPITSLSEVEAWYAAGLTANAVTEQQYAILQSAAVTGVTPPVEVDEDAIADAVIAGINQSGTALTDADVDKIVSEVTTSIRGLSFKAE